MTPTREELSAEIWTAIKSALSFSALPIDRQYGLQGRILKDVWKVYEKEGEVYFEAYKGILFERFARVNWIWIKDKNFVFKKWNQLQSEMKKTMNPEGKAPREVIIAQMDMLNRIAESIGDHLRVNEKPKHEKRPGMGWIRVPRT